MLVLLVTVFVLAGVQAVGAVLVLAQMLCGVVGHLLAVGLPGELALAGLVLAAVVARLRWLSQAERGAV